jgi:enoyl-CoA hydratase/carnithine racemase
MLWVSIDAPPVNLMTAQLLLDLDAVAASAENDPGLHVIVLQSANPDFFLAHGDLSFVEDPATYAALPIAEETLVATGPMMRLHERWRRLPQTTIAKIAGLARGGGSELVSSLDVRFAALEIVLTGGLVDATTAERWAWVNRALPAAELDEFVEWVAQTIATLPDGVRAAATEAIDAAGGPLEDALRVEDRLLGETFTDASGELARAALAAGVHTREVKLKFEEVLRANLARHP